MARREPFWKRESPTPADLESEALYPAPLLFDPILPELPENVILLPDTDVLTLLSAKSNGFPHLPRHGLFGDLAARARQRKLSWVDRLADTFDTYVTPGVWHELFAGPVMNNQEVIDAYLDLERILAPGRIYSDGGFPSHPDLKPFHAQVYCLTEALVRHAAHVTQTGDEPIGETDVELATTAAYISLISHRPTVLLTRDRDLGEAANTFKDVTRWLYEKDVPILHRFVSDAAGSSADPGALRRGYGRQLPLLRLAAPSPDYNAWQGALGSAALPRI